MKKAINNTPIYDFIGIGVGPFNLGLAALSSPIEELNCLFFDKAASFDWHPGMMIEGTTLQVPFMADLVSLAAPTSPYSFLNYIKKMGRIYSFYIRENFLLLRKEYNHYCQWVIEQLENVHFKSDVEQIYYKESEGLYHVSVFNQELEQTQVYKTKKLVMGTGTRPYLPKCCLTLNKEVVHSAHYLQHKANLQQKKSITLVGSGQSAAEIFYDLLQDIDNHNYSLNWLTRSGRFFPLEYTKLTLEMTSPEYVDYFYNLPIQKRESIINKQKNLYKGINGDLINAIHELLYTKRLDNQNLPVFLQTNVTLKEAAFDNRQSCFDLTFHQHEQDQHFAHQTEGLVLATGYHYQVPACLNPIVHRIKWNQQQRFDVHRNYSIDHQHSEIFVQNAELHTHGFVTPDLGMGAYRNSYILREITGQTHYPIEEQIAFQQFGVPQRHALATLKHEL